MEWAYVNRHMTDTSTLWSIDSPGIYHMAGVTLEAGGKRHKSMRNWTLMIKWGLGVSSGCPKNPEEIKFTLAGMEKVLW